MAGTRKARKQARRGRPGVDPTIGDDAVERRTGRRWAAWFARLDKAGGRGMSHKQLVAWMKTNEPAIGGWWTQSVVVAYEQKRGLRARHEKPGGYEIGKSRTVPVAVSTLYRAWSEKRRRARWLGDDAGFTVRKATRDTSMRITWIDGTTHVDASFWPKGASKSMVQVQHKKLTTAEAAERMKRYWGEALDALKGHLA